MTSAMLIGVGARALAGEPVPSLFRSRGRPRKSLRPGAPKRSGHWVDDDDALAIAIGLMADDCAQSRNGAAIAAVCIRAGLQARTKAALDREVAGFTEQEAATYSLLRKRIRRVSDKLYADWELDAHLAWLRQYPQLRAGRTELLLTAIGKGQRARLFGKGSAALRS